MSTCFLDKKSTKKNYAIVEQSCTPETLGQQQWYISCCELFRCEFVDHCSTGHKQCNNASSISSCSLAFTLKELGVLPDDCFLGAFVFAFSPLLEKLLLQSLSNWKWPRTRVHFYATSDWNTILHRYKKIEALFTIFLPSNPPMTFAKI